MTASNTRRSVRPLVTALALVALLMPASVAFGSGAQDSTVTGPGPVATENGPLDGWAYGAIASYRAAHKHTIGHAANPLDGWAYGAIASYRARAAAAASRPPAARNDFSWRDAGIGASAAFAVFFLAVGALVASRRRQSVPGLGS